MRHSENPNLRLHFEDGYQSLPVQTQHGPLVVEYLDLLHLTVQRALAEHPRVFAFRVDLRFALERCHDEYLNCNAVLERFFESFKAKIRHNRAMAEQKFGRAHSTTVRHVWAREVGLSGHPHYHLVLLLNQDAFSVLGKFESGRDNLYNRLQEAWASALRLPVQSVVGLVEVPENACYYLRRGDPVGVAQLFYRASYLCKAKTKVFGSYCHAFGASRC